MVAVLWSRTVARRLRTSRLVAALLLFAFGFVAAATLVPDAAAMTGASSDGICDFSRIGFAPIDELLRVNFTSLNVLLFVPLGVAVALLPRTKAAAMVTIAAIATPFVVETIQLVATVLGRGCQTADVFDNLFGLAIGLVIGTLARPLLARVSGPHG
jgi:glycopeptide antibiotics resistance protein